MTRYELFKFLHVLLAIVWVGGGILALLFSQRAVKASQEHRAGFAHDMQFVADKVFAPSAMLTLVFGVLMVLTTDALSFGDTWILIGLGGVLASIVIGIGILTPLVKKMFADMEGGGTGQGPLTAILRYSYIDNVVLLIVVWAMIAKPGA